MKGNSIGLIPIQVNKITVIDKNQNNNLFKK